MEFSCEDDRFCVRARISSQKFSGLRERGQTRIQCRQEFKPRWNLIKNTMLAQDRHGTQKDLAGGAERSREMNLPALPWIGPLECSRIAPGTVANRDIPD